MAATLHIVHRQRRIFRCYYACTDCHLEWNDELLVAGVSWCPCCEQRRKPRAIEEFEEDRPECED